MKKNQILILALLSCILTSCIVSSAAKVVKTTAKIGIGVVKGTVKGVAWTVKKAEGKINEDRIDGIWKVVGVYNGTYEQFANDSNPENNFKTACTTGFEVIEFKSNREKFKPIHCDSQEEDWVKYDYKFGKNPISKEKENYFKYNSSNYVTIIDVTNNTMVLEGNLMAGNAFSGKLFMFEKVK